ncbi:MAG: GAF domain-containing protein [Anaerolineae bacterium]|nr:MAG: GAF domain-containing protein [Anaerolineae bacterium]
MAQGALTPAGYAHRVFQDIAALEKACQEQPPDVLLLDMRFGGGNVLSLLERLKASYPLLQPILLTGEPDPKTWRHLLRVGVADVLSPPLRTSDLLETIKHVLARRETLIEKVVLPLKKDTQSLASRSEALEHLAEVGRMVTSSLSLDTVLKAAVDAAVNLTGAQEGSILLLDERTGELYVRAERNFDDSFVRTFRLKVEDSLAGKVLESGEPLYISRQGPQKIKTAYLVHSLIYAPLRAKGRVIGVLGVDHREKSGDFTPEHLMVVSAIADFAASAIENARLHAHTEAERNKLETILTNVRDGVLVLDEYDNILFINKIARQAFDVPDANFTGKHVSEVIVHEDMLHLIEMAYHDLPEQAEIRVADGRYFSVQGAKIPSVGLALTMHDISQLKELDRIKSEFVSTVSHDLRSPLTAVMGYVELLGRVGPLNDQQQAFIQRVQISLQNITSLINELLDLGKIEAGFDTHRELVDFGTLVRFVGDELRLKAEEKTQQLNVAIEPDLPTLLASPTRLQQVAENLIGNAIKYTPVGGRVEVRVFQEEHQVILQVSDNGPGIPPADQPYIFDKFYRASNVPDDVPGSGLGLAIVKSIVEAHDGRVWVESFPGEGTTFTVVLPALNEDEAISPLKAGL